MISKYACVSGACQVGTGFSLYGRAQLDRVFEYSAIYETDHVGLLRLPCPTLGGGREVPAVFEDALNIG